MTSSSRYRTTFHLLIPVLIAAPVLAACGQGSRRAITETTGSVLEPPGTVATTAPAAPDATEATEATTTTSAPTTTTTTWGIGPDRVLTGPGGLRVDLSACPEGWRDDAGSTTERILLGSSAALEGTYAVFSAIPRGLRARLDQLNAAGGVGGRRVELELVDDGFEPARTAANASQLTDEQDVLALVGIPGTNQNEPVAELASAGCVPHLPASPHGAYSNAALRPWVTGLTFGWSSESLALLRVVAAERPGSTVVVVSDDDREYGDFSASDFLLASSLVPGVQVLPAIRVPAGTTDPSDVVAQVTASGATSVVVATTSAATPALLAALQAEAALAERWAVQGVAPSRLVAAGAEGWRQIRVPEPPTTATTEVEARFLAAAAAAGVPDTERAAFWQGYTAGELLVTALQRAAAGPGGPTRTNLLLALWSMDQPHPAMPGVRAHTAGPADSHLVEGAVVHRVSGGTLAPVGPVDVDGLTPSCRSTSPRVAC